MFTLKKFWLKFYFDKNYFSGQFYNFTLYMICVNSIVNPFVYAIQYHEFQQRVKEMFYSKPDKVQDVESVKTAESTVKTNEY